MQILITERHAQADDQIKSYAREKAGKLIKFYDRISAIEIILSGSSNGHNKVEMIVKVDGSEDFVAQDGSSDFLAGVDLVVEKLESQLRRYKEKHRNRKHMAKNPVKEM